MVSSLRVRRGQGSESQVARWGWGGVESRKPVHDIQSLESLAIVDANAVALDRAWHQMDYESDKCLFIE